ncbi:glycine N-acyltransferase-like protein 3 [Dunckerocampus dactyliophorus]|uniref:glycine N-acyltransferase-like protein 3 n=1 Tax=Dunckerocampus dactyliophorus TaxID=161453 RepID=UPI0024076790|nr:glycine N-acyltransferase-like protein 3 [Dunckerocampus dactyliophorus]
MRILQKDELVTAEEVLLKHLPKSFQLYGLVYAYNKNEPNPIQFIVDTWPDFKVFICRPDTEKKQDFTRKVAIFSMDEQILKKMLSEEGAVDWSSYFRLGGCDVSHTSTIREVSLNRKVSYHWVASTNLLYLPDSRHLDTPTFDSKLKSRISSLSLSHVDLINRNWNLGGSERTHKNITFLISNLPSCCITDDQGQPVSWILVYECSALGVLYTLPEHRRKGYAKVLIYTMAQRRLAEGYPVFCYITEDNAVSYKIFKSMGFIEDPSYRASSFEINI